MGRKRKPDEEAARWFAAMYEQSAVNGATMEIRAFPAAGGSLVRHWTDCRDEFVDIVKKLRDDHHVYFGVAGRARGISTKKGVLGAATLWAEVDTEKLGWETQDVAVALNRLPRSIRPSACVHSGYGLHLYWFLREPLTDIEQIEDANRALAELVSGDRVWNADRILRVPSSKNLKYGAKKECRVIWCRHWQTFDPDDLINDVLDYKHVLYNAKWISLEEAAQLKEATFIDDDRAEQIVQEDRRKTANARGERIWDRCRYGGGPGYVGIDEAVTLYVANRYCRLEDPTPNKVNAIVRDTLQRIEEVWKRDAANEDWSWTAEEKEVRDKLKRWAKRWAQIVASRPKSQLKKRMKEQAREAGRD